MKKWLNIVWCNIVGHRFDFINYYKCQTTSELAVKCINCGKFIEA